MAHATAEKFYNEMIEPLPVPERLKLATIILEHIPQHAVIDYSEEWSEEDYRDFSAASWAHISRRLEGEESDGQTG
ncbi:MAG: hypothetical protein HY318_19045 [Armatimonadetes bacterium]|nr:hypothetical protein [Armatimonadota bacterium]